jgi:diacylglycerol O-acyltransferase
MGFDRLRPLDASFLHMESPRQPMHVGSLAVFEGAPFFGPDGCFRLDDVRRRVASRLHLVPRFRQRLMTVPFGQGLPVWVDDERFDIAYHVRLTALPAPGDEARLKALMGRIQSQMLDRSRPLWELWFVEGLAGGRVGLIQKTHHALIDGISGVDVASVLLDVEPGVPDAEPEPWQPRAAPSAVELLARSLLERAVRPAELVRSAGAAVRVPGRLAGRLVGVGRALGALGRTAPRLPFNTKVGFHRRVELVRVPLAEVKAIRRATGATVNDVVVAAVAGALRRYLEARGIEVDGLRVRALIPVSVRDPSERMVLGNRVSAMVADLPVALADPAARLAAVRDELAALKAGGEALGAQAIIALADFAPPTLVGLAARLLPHQRWVNLVVTNVPGPQFPLYFMGARMLEAFPYVGVVDNVALIVAVLSYDGQLGFSLCADADAVADLEVLAEGLEKSFAELRRVTA